jgi:serine/threonine protein kinase
MVTWTIGFIQNVTTSNTMGLPQRLDIVVDDVDTVEYMHNYCQPPIMSRDLKPRSILLADDGHEYPS